MDISIIVGAITTLISGVGGFWLSKRQIKNDERKYNADDFVLLKQSWQEEFTRLKAKVDATSISEQECNKKYAELELKYRALSAQIKLIEVSSPRLRAPQWLKDEDGVMLSLNDAYEDTFLVPIGKKREDYVGKTDIEFWGTDIGTIYRNHDLQVMRDKKPYSSIEPVKGPDGIYNVYVIKYPILMDEKYVVGIGGQSVESGLIENLVSLAQTKPSVK